MATHLDLLERNRRIDERYKRIDRSLVTHYSRNLPSDCRRISRWFIARDHDYRVTSGDGDERVTSLVAGPPAHLHLAAKLACVVSAEDFYRRLVAPSPAAADRQRHFDAWRTKLRSLVPRSRLDNLPLRDRIRGRRPLAWLRLYEPLEELIESCSTPTDIANRVRDALSLEFVPPTHLIMLVFPRGYFCRSTVPTFVDGGDRSGFVAPDEPEAVCWRSWDLRSQAPGVPEVVTDPTLLNVQVEVYYLGRVTTIPQPVRL